MGDAAFEHGSEKYSVKIAAQGMKKIIESVL